MNEVRLIKNLKDRDPMSLLKLISTYQGYAAAIVRNVGRGSLSESDVEELTADVFLAVWQTADKLQAGKIKAYIGAIARNKAKSHLRTVKQTVPIEDEILFDAADLQADVEHELLREAIQNAIDSLPKQDGEILIRYYYYYQQLSEIACEMGFTVSAAKARLCRARQKLKQLLIERGYTYETEFL